MEHPVGTIIFEDVTKTYHIAQRAAPRVGAWLLSKAFEYFRREPFHALSGVSFAVKPGEMVGFLGHNGAGKSSILKLVAGISQPTSGNVVVSGPVTSLLELGVGFHPELTGMENIFYNGAMMGMSRDQILQRLETIIVFSGLADFIYEPVKHYSSGMYSRLGCAVALHLEPKILLIDEILAVGDAEFQERGIRKILDLHAAGVTILLVTHETTTARDICDRLIWLEHGRVQEEGDPQHVHENYTRSMMMRIHREGPFAALFDEAAPRHTRIESVRFLVHDQETDTVETDQPASVRVRVTGEAPAARIGIQWRWPDGRVLNADVSEPAPLAGGALEATYEIPRWPFYPTTLTMAAVILAADGEEIYDRQSQALTVRVKTPGFEVPNFLVKPRTTWTIRKA